MLQKQVIISSQIEYLATYTMSNLIQISIISTRSKINRIILYVAILRSLLTPPPPIPLVPATSSLLDKVVLIPTKCFDSNYPILCLVFILFVLLTSGTPTQGSVGETKKGGIEKKCV